MIPGERELAIQPRTSRWRRLRCWWRGGHVFVPVKRSRGGTLVLIECVSCDLMRVTSTQHSETLPYDVGWALYFADQ